LQKFLNKNALKQETITPLLPPKILAASNTSLKRICQKYQRLTWTLNCCTSRTKLVLLNEIKNDLL
jgi:hypothetical protein